MTLTRREFVLTGSSLAGGFLLFSKGGKSLFNFRFLTPQVDNPLEHYPDRDWEKIYRDQYRYDSSFTYVCSPNDTHACRVRAFVRNGVIVRIEQNYDSDKVGDIYGNKATINWNPRMCPKGYTFHRRVYGPYRLRYPLIRKGWKQWADDGFPELTPENMSKYKFDSRGLDELIRIDWESAVRYAARGFIHIATKYSGEKGAELLRKQGYAPEMIEATHGAGTLTMKFRGGMGLLGVIGKYGMYRFSNMLGLLDSKIRGVSPDQAYGGRLWDNYTWHGDQAPGHPFVHGLQAQDCDFNDLRFAKLHIQAGKNLVENKMPDSHWFIETLERGGKIVTITPEYSPPATKSDYWLPIRPGSDAALFLGITKYMIDKGWYDAKFLKDFTDFPLLVRKDTLKRLKASDIFKDYKPGLTADSISFQRHGMTQEQYEKTGDLVVWDVSTNRPKAVTREDIGKTIAKKGIDPSLEGEFIVEGIDGKEIQVATLFTLYKNYHLNDYDIDSVAEMTQTPKSLIVRLAEDIYKVGLVDRQPVAIHVGEGINHYFHATEINRATYLPLVLVGAIGRPGAGSFTWAGNYKAATFQGSKESGAGFLAWIAEDPFNPNLDPDADGKDIKVRKMAKDEAVAFWNHGDTPLIVNTPKYGRKCFTGHTHMPTPTKALWFTNVNLFNNAKWAYEMLKNVNPKIEMICSTDIELTASIEYSDIAFPANSWCEFETHEITTSCSNPFVQIWKGGIKPVYDSKDDVKIIALVAQAIGEETGDKRYADYWKFALEGRPEVYIQRLLDASITLRGYKFSDIISGRYGEPGACLMLYRSYPRVPFYEQIVEDEPFFTPTGRLQLYNDEPEVIEYGENFIVHREAVEATPYLPNAIVSSNPYIRPEDYGIPLDEIDGEARHVRNVKMPWSRVKNTKNPLWNKGYQFFCLTPKSRHKVHSQWSTTDWHFIWSSNFGDPYRMDKRSPGVSEHQLHINPEAAKDLGVNDGDYVYVDANPLDRPYKGWKPWDPFYKVARLMVRAKYNPAYPYNIVMIKHASWISTEKSVKAHETRKDGQALSETGYQASFRYGSQQSLTRSWLMPMHMTDTLFHKLKVKIGFMFGGEADNHYVNTVPKETLVRITKAENGGLGGRGIWEPARTGNSPANEDDGMKRFLDGDFVKTG